MIWPALMLFVAGGCSTVERVIRVERSEIQSRLDARFPIEKERLMVQVKLENPVVVLEPGSDRIGMQLDVSVTAPVPIGSTRGQGRVSGVLSYKRMDGAFFFTAPRIETLTLEGKTPEEVDRLRGPIEWIAGVSLTVFPVYSLDRSNYKEAAASLVLKDVSVADGGLEIEMGLGR